MDYDALLDHLGRAPATSYRYPHRDVDLDCTVHASMRREERALWEEALDRALGGSRVRASGVALDAGCGTGEMLLGLAGRFEHVVGIEPDPRRSAQARERSPQTPVFTLGLGDPVLGESKLAGSFRFAHCLQVLGHVPCQAAGGLLSSLAGLVEPGGAVVLALPYTNGFEDLFRSSDLATLVGQPMERKAFDEAATLPQSGLLPVRHFSMLSIEPLLARAGLKPVWYAPYGWFDEQTANLIVLAVR
ncbi:MAG: class I SAM-dependent methyltransferase [Deltaproteobacteria bacterium]|nr:class I SAM-dependent methyltransferase [Deltaproteobacteria bacterium]